jgi:hypothetical protein
LWCACDGRVGSAPLSEKESLLVEKGSVVDQIDGAGVVSWRVVGRLPIGVVERTSPAPVSNDNLRSESGPLPSFTTEGAGVVVSPSCRTAVFLRVKSRDPNLPDCLVRLNEETSGSSTSEVRVIRRATSFSEPSSV